MLHQMLRSEVFKCNEVEASVYVHDELGVILAVYVDVIIIINPTQQRMEEIKGTLKRYFSMVDREGTIKRRMS